MDIQPRFDCHNKTYPEVEDRFPNWLLLNQNNTPLYVITGNSDRMKELIIKYLTTYNFSYSIPPHNHGMIVVN